MQPGQFGMSEMDTQHTHETSKKRRRSKISPEINEVLHMLNALESQAEARDENRGGRS